MSRRTFVHGASAAAAGAFILGRVAAPLSRQGRLAPLTGGLDSSSSVFGFVQAAPAASGGASVTVTLPDGTGLTNNPAAGNLLVATLVSNSTASFAPPVPTGYSSSPWRLAAAAPFTAGSSSGRVEIWYWPGTPVAQGNPGGSAYASATFTNPAATNCRGTMAEFSLPAGMIAVLDAPGQAAGTGSTFDITAASGNAANALGIVMVGDFFSANTTGTWTGPSDWTGIAHGTSNIAHAWSSWYDLSLAEGVAGASPNPLLSASFNATITETGWGMAYAAFRAVAFQPLNLGGAEMANIVAADPSGQALILGGDVEGVWRTADYGDHWQMSQDGMYGAQWRCTAALAWSQFSSEPSGTVYACVGKKAANFDGGFLVSTDGGVTWSMRAQAKKTGSQPWLGFQANSAGAPLPSGESQTSDRSVGNLIAQDNSGSAKYLYVATYNGGIGRSASLGADGGWTQIGLSETGFYPRGLALNPNDTSHLWAACWDSDETGAFGGVWQCSTAQTATSTSDWTQLPIPPFPAYTPPAGYVFTGTAADVKVIGDHLYAVFPTLGVYRRPVTASTSAAWTNLSDGTLITTSGGQLWTSLDGYVESPGGAHQIIAACGHGVTLPTNNFTTNVVQITIPASGPIAYADLTGQSTITVATLPPDDQPWWHASASGKNWLGHTPFVNPHVLINPADTTHNEAYVTGASGFYRTRNATAAPGSVSWQLAVNGAPMSSVNQIVTDPTDPGHVILCGNDYPHLDLTDATGWNTSNVQQVPFPDNTLESNAAAVSLDGTTVFAGANTKYGQDAGGKVYTRSSSGTTWTDTGYDQPASMGGTGQDSAPAGMYSGQTPGGTTYIVVASVSGGMWRALPSTTEPKGWAWSGPFDSSSGLCTGNTTVQSISIVAQTITGIPYLYCFDPASGVWRSKNNSGAGWALIWGPLSSPPLTLPTDSRSGWLALNPLNPGELWVSTWSSSGGGLYRLSNATSNTVGTGTGMITATSMTTNSSGTNRFSNGSGGMAFTPSGIIYAVSLNGPAPNGISQPNSAKLLSLVSGGTADNWLDADPVGSTIGSYVSWPGPVATAQATINGSTKNIAIVATNPNFGVYGIVS
jgi:hypothetical protein